jgi:hypothetical protein
MIPQYVYTEYCLLRIKPKRQLLFKERILLLALMLKQGFRLYPPVNNNR